jgi:hypothetical protein
MNTHIAWFLASLIMTLSPLSGASRDEQWKEVDDAIAQGLPRTALEKLDPLITDTLNAQAWGEAAKAIARRVTLEAQIEGSRAEEHIVRMESELARAPIEIVPLLKTLQAHWYWQYFQQNRWRFMQRTATDEAPGEDFTTWDLPRLFAEIDRRFQSALENSEQLQQTPIETFDEFLVRGTQPDRYRPTLYDFIAHEALSFYTAGEQAGAKPQDAFVLSADSPIFDPVDQFMAWAPHQTGDSDSPILRAIELYQDLLRFHRGDTDPTAFLDVDLARLLFGHNMGTGENKGERYVTALDRFVQEWADHEVAAMALFHWAQYHQGEQQPAKAHQLASRGWDTHPDSAGGRSCWNLIQQIEAQTISITTEQVWNQPLPEIQVQYRNLTNLHLRIVAWDWVENLALRPFSDDHWEDFRKEMLSRQPALQWSATLPSTDDFKLRTEGIPAPDSLAPGHYYLLASPDPEFGTVNNQVHFAPFWVSDLALIVRSHDAALEGFVLEANSGEPIIGAEVMAWQQDRQGNRIQHGPFQTDDLGFYRAPIRPQFGYLIHVRHEGQELATFEDMHAQLERKPHAQNRTMLFTDRALYRPGQTIQYKGICLRIDLDQDDYQALSGQSVVVVLRDPNGREVARAQHRCNDYGSFSGSFTAPRDAVLGQMTLQAIEGPSGASHVQVEEYKRPQFRVTLDPPQIAPRLNDAVLVTGNAESYTGAPVDGAEVRYRVVREVRWPYWRHWFSARLRPIIQESQEIAHGTTRTDTSGNFALSFNAQPDPRVEEVDGLYFVYTVHADVTGIAGETRSSQRGIHVGFAALKAVIDADDWQTSDQPVALTVRTTTLDDQPQVAEGVVRVHRLIPPHQVHRAQLERRHWPWGSSPNDDDTDPSDPNNWELGEIESERGFSTDATGVVTLEFTLEPGAYRVLLDSQDRFGRTVTALMPLQVLDPTADQLKIKVPHLLAAPAWSVEPGDEFTALWGTGYETGRAFVEIEHRGKIIQRFWTPADQTQARIQQTVTEEMRGGFTLHVTYVRENRAYLESRKVEVPWTNQHLDIRWERFRSKLGPAEKETWSAVIAPQAREKEGDVQDEGRDERSVEFAVAEMVATLYDASLDAFLPHQWNRRFDFFRQDYSRRRSVFGNESLALQHLHGQWSLEFVDSTFTYRSFPHDLIWDPRGQMMYSRYGLQSRGATFGGGARLEMLSLGTAMAPMSAPPSAGMEMERFSDAAIMVDKLSDDGGAPPHAPAPDLGQVTARRNLQETAFFFPQLLSDSNGVVRMSFTMPEALTTWRFMGFAHDKKLRSGYLEGQTITAKDLMVRPNPPRFLREGDELEFTVQVLNQSPARQTGRVRLTFNEAFADTPVDAALNNTTPEIEFDIPSKESRAYSWRIRVPDGMGFLTYKAVAATGQLSDGEEGYLPVLSRRILVTESLPLPIRGPSTNRFQFEKLLSSGQSETLQHQNLVVQMVSNPAWYAVLALPYLMEFPHECTEQTFNRLYANALARFIANSDPRIRRVFDLWKNTPALDSPLEKNEDLKAVAIEETPWLRQAQSESQARRNVGILFDSNRLDYETDRLLQRMAELQLPDGSWSWFPGGRPNEFITLYITTGFGRLRHLGAEVDVGPALRSLDRLDGWIAERHRRILEQANPHDYVPGPTEALYLYGRSFFLRDKPIAGEHRQAVDFFLGQSRKHWVKVSQRQSQGHLALALKRFNAAHTVNDSTPLDIMRSLKERSVVDPELGRYWRDTEFSWWWYRAPIETQALMIEAFDEVLGDADAVEDCQVWLLKQKQTQDWKTTKATADAVYALLLRGTDRLASDLLVEVRLGDLDITPQRGAHESLPASARVAPAESPAIEPGTGFYERRFGATEIEPAFGEITVTKRDPGVAWGGVHWQYLEDLGQVTPHEATPLKLTKQLFTKRNTPRGPVLEAVNGPVSVGDELVVRIELRVDRDMEYVHLKDQRGSGTEPMNVLSRYRYQDGLAYYESTRDTASHFFIDYLPRGVYVFEYSSRIQHRGRYPTGIASIQCLYAPEFNSHSQSILLEVHSDPLPSPAGSSANMSAH